MSTDEPGAPVPPPCAHCGVPLEAGRITCPGCGQARSLGFAADEAVPPPPAGPPPGPAPAPHPAPRARPGSEAFDLGDPFRERPRRQPRGPAERSRTGLLVGGLIGLVLVVLVAATALWAMGQNGAGS